MAPKLPDPGERQFKGLWKQSLQALVLKYQSELETFQGSNFDTDNMCSAFQKMRPYLDQQHRRQKGGVRPNRLLLLLYHLISVLQSMQWA